VDPNTTSIVLAIIGLLSLFVQAFMLIRTGKLVTTTAATHALVNGQTSSLVAAVTGQYRAEGFIAGQAAGPGSELPAPPLVPDVPPAPPASLTAPAP
jgi:hypothetical protein